VESGNPLMTFPIKKRINTELFIDRKQESYYTKMVQETFGLRGLGRKIKAGMRA